MCDTLENINAVISQVDRLACVLSDDVLGLRTDLAAGYKNAEGMIKAKLTVASKLAETKKLLQDLETQSNRFDADTLGLKQ